MSSWQTSGHRDNDGWSAALGDAKDPLDSKDALIPVPPPPRPKANLPRNLIIVLLCLAVVGAAVFVILKQRQNNRSPDAGASNTYSLSVPPTTTAPASGGATLSNTATEHAYQLSQALTAVVNWGQLAPFLANLSTKGVPTTCLNVTSSNESRCRFGAKGATRHAVLVGDIAALDYLPAIEAELAPHGWDVQVLTESNCPVSRVAITINKVLDTSCASHDGFVSRQLASIKPALIVASDSDGDLAYATAPPKRKHARHESSKTAYINGLSAAVSSMAKVGKVVYVGSPPGTKSIPECQRDVRLPKSCAAAPAPSWLAYQSLVRAAIKGHADYLDPTPWFCSGGRCPAIVGVTPTYVDGIQVDNAYAASLAFGFASYVNA